MVLESQSSSGIGERVKCGVREHPVVSVGVVVLVVWVLMVLDIVPVVLGVVLGFLMGVFVPRERVFWWVVADEQEQDRQRKW